MSKYPILANAPIIEAMIDIQVKMLDHGDTDPFDAIYNKIKNDYPRKESIIMSQLEYAVQLKKSDSTYPNKSEEPVGYRFISSDEKLIVQMRRDGFTFSRLNPYESWDSFYSEAKRLWQLYSNNTNPDIKKVSVRFVNNLNIPLPIHDFGDYLTAPIIIPEGLPQEMMAFLSRYGIFKESLGAIAIITQALNTSIIEKNAPVILDIETVKEYVDSVNEQVAWETIQNLRDFKNDIFFKSITDKLKELYK